MEEEKTDGQVQTRRELEDLFVLKSLGLSIKQGEFVCVIGDVGSGKTSLLMSMVGDLLYANP